jgi:hypothetical protein
LRVEAEVPSGHHGLLLLFDSEGNWTRLGTAAAADAPVKIEFPADRQKGAPLSGPPGTEAVLLVARPHTPVSEDEVRFFWGAAAVWPALPALSVLQLTGTSVKALQHSRGFDSPVGQTDPEGAVRKHLEEAGQRLKESYPVVVVVAFAHLE